MVFIKTEPLVGFRNQYATSGVPGCILGYSEFRSLCQSPSYGLGFNLPGYTGYKEFKVYVPAGTTFYSVSGNFPQNTRYAVAAKLGAPPIKTTLSDAEYESIRTSNSPDPIERLLAGEEVVVVHNYGGNLSLSGVGRLSGRPVSQGQWLFFRVISGESVYSLGLVNEVDLSIYANSFSKTSFGPDGDPIK